MTLDELQKLCDAATPGPWTHHRQQHCPQINCHEIELRTRHGGALYRSTSYGLMEVDGEFISAARTEMPKLIKRVHDLRHLLKRASNFIDPDAGRQPAQDVLDEINTTLEEQE